MTSIANHDDVAYWDYTGVRQFLVSLSIVSHQLKDIPMVQHALKNLNWRFPRSLKQLQIYLFPTAVFFLVGCWNKCGLWEIWNCFLTLLHQEQNDCHLKIVYQSYEDLFQIFLWSTSIQTKHQFQICLGFFFDPCVLAWSTEVITSLQTWYSFIYPNVGGINNFAHDIIIKL